MRCAAYVGPVYRVHLDFVQPGELKILDKGVHVGRYAGAGAPVKGIHIFRG